MLHLTENSYQNFWNIVKDIKEDFLLRHIDPKCILWETLLNETFVENMINVVQETVKLNTTIEPMESVTQKTLKTASEMFTYLFFCPPNDIISFYKHLLNTATANDIMIALSKFLKISQNAAKESSYKIFMKSLSTLNLEIHDKEDFNNLSKGFTSKIQNHSFS